MNTKLHLNFKYSIKENLIHVTIMHCNIICIYIFYLYSYFGKSLDLANYKLKLKIFITKNFSVEKVLMHIETKLFTANF